MKGGSLSGRQLTFHRIAMAIVLLTSPQTANELFTAQTVETLHLLNRALPSYSMCAQRCARYTCIELEYCNSYIPGYMGYNYHGRNRPRCLVFFTNRVKTPLSYSDTVYTCIYVARYSCLFYTHLVSLRENCSMHWTRLMMARNYCSAYCTD